MRAVFHAPPPSKRIGRFLPTKRLGAGAMGVVLAATDEVLGRDVAIKLIAPNRSGSAKARNRMLLEARALAKLSHPNVVPIYEAGVLDDGQVFVAMELVEGRTLRGLGTSTFGWRDVVSIYIQAGRGLCAAHDIGLVHRDFKPDNVMYGDDGRVRVLDFGLAMPDETLLASDGPAEPGVSTTAPETGRGAGTPAYMAPEQFLGLEVDARSDQFAFCVALHEAVYSVRPFPGRTVAELAAAVVDGRIQTPPRRGPRWLYRLVRQGLAIEPRQRHEDLNALVRALERGLQTRRRASIFAIAGIVAAGVVSAWAATRTSASADTSPAYARPTGVAASAARIPTQVSGVADGVAVEGVALSPDGTSMAYWGSRGGGTDLVVRSRSGGERFVVAGVGAPDRPLFPGLRFTADGHVLWLATDDGRSLWLHAAAPHDASQRRVREVAGVRALEPYDRTGVAAGWRPVDTPLAISEDGNRVLVRTRTDRGDTIEMVDATGRPTRLVKTANAISAVAWSPDERRIVWTELSDLSARIHVAAVDGSKGPTTLADVAGERVKACSPAVVLADDHTLIYSRFAIAESGESTTSLWEQSFNRAGLEPTGPAVALTASLNGCPSSIASGADGNVVAFPLRPEPVLELLEIEQGGALGPPRPAGHDTSPTGIHVWSSDGRIIVGTDGERGYSISAYDPGRFADARLFDVSSRASRVLRADENGIVLLDSPSGRQPPLHLFRVALDGKKELVATIRDKITIGAASCARDVCSAAFDTGDEIVIRELPLSDTAPRVLARASTHKRPSQLFWSVAPDGKRGAIPVDDSVYVVPLDGGGATRLSIEHDAGLDVPVLQYVAWAVDGSSLFVAARNVGGYRHVLLRLRLDGTYTILHREDHRWIVKPRVSHDGRTLAVLMYGDTRRLWVLDR